MEEIHYLLGNSCNLNCDFCFWDKRTQDVPLDFKKKIVDEIFNSGIHRVTISGGEPTCSNNFTETLEYMHNKNLEIILHTNGLDINESLAQKISPMISRISLTMDAVDTDIQFQMRKTHDITNHTLSLIRIFHDLNIPVSIKTLITKTNKGEIEKIGTILNNLPIAYWSLLEFTPLNRGKLNQNVFLLEPSEFDNICTEVKSAFPSINVKIKKFCDCKNNYCFIAPNGDVFTYDKNRGDVLIGNITSNKLRTLIEKIEAAY